MSYFSKFALAGGTLACAVGVGFIMQNTEAAKNRYRTPDAPEKVIVKPIAPKADRDSNQDTAPLREEARLEIEAMSLTSALPDRIVEFGQELSQSAAPLVCEVNATASPASAAMVQISVQAPCLVNERVTVHHNGMMFTETTTQDGSMDLLVPALSKRAFFMLAFANGKGTSVQSDVVGLDQYDRVVMQWNDNRGFELHAHELGAASGTKDLAWTNATQDPSGVKDSDDGFLIRVGNANAPEPLLADIYSFPRGSARKTGSVTFSLETEITNANCGQDIHVQSLEKRGQGGLKSQNLVLSVPPCDAIGGHLVLNNLLEDLKVASN